MSKKKFPIIVKRGHTIVKVYKTPTRSCDSYTVVHYIGEKRQRRSFADLEKAILEAETVANKLSTGELDVLTLRSDDRLAYVRAVEALRPTGIPIELAAIQFAEAVKKLNGVPLSRAIDFYLQRNPVGTVPRIVKDVVEELLEYKRGEELSRRYLKQLEYDLQKFAGDFNVPIGSVLGTDIDRWLRSQDIGARTHNNFRASIGTLFRFAKLRRYLPKDHDELESVPLIKAVGGEIEVFTPAELEEILSVAREPVISFLALGAFAGVRHAEIQRLNWQDIRLDAGVIEIRAGKAKTASRRIIPISENLKNWLKPYAKASGPVCLFANMAEQITDLTADINRRRKSAGDKEPFLWKHNGLRHSFISYRIAKIQNVAQVALEAGNSPTMIFRHYRELVAVEDAEKWFSIAPEASIEDGKQRHDPNVVPMKQAA